MPCPPPARELPRSRIVDGARAFAAHFALGVFCVALAAGCSVLPAPRGPSEPLRVTLLAFNDFHGNLEIPAGTVTMAETSDPTRASAVRAGGIAHLVTLVKQLRAGNADTAVIAAGDLIGASPSTSALLRDEPAIEALGALGLEATTVGNHEFDRGIAELKRMQNGGCHRADRCAEGVVFPGARFRYLAANVVDAKTGDAIFPAYLIRRFQGVPVAFVGVVVRDTPSVVAPFAVAGLHFRDEAETINALVPELKRQGVEAIVALIHEGGATTSAYNDPTCANFSGAIVDIAQRLDAGVDLIVSGHTHQAYICRINGRLLTQAGSYGRYLTEIDVFIDRASRDVVRTSARNHVVDSARLPADALASEIVERARAATVRITSERVASMAIALSRKTNPAGESALGNLVADSQLAASSGADAGGAQFALMNTGGIRADLVARDGIVRFGDIFAVLPFSNDLVVVELSGAQIRQLLEQQWSAAGAANVMQVSHNFAYRWDAARPIGSRVVPESITLDGAPLVAESIYRVAVNDFMAGGGDGFTVLTKGRNHRHGTSSRDALVDYLRAHADAPLPRGGRIRRTN